MLILVVVLALEKSPPGIYHSPGTGHMVGLSLGLLVRKLLISGNLNRPLTYASEISTSTLAFPNIFYSFQTLNKIDSLDWNLV